MRLLNDKLSDTDSCWSKDQGNNEDQLRGFWRDVLRGAPALLQLPCDRPRPSEPSHAAGRLAAELPAALEASLRELAARMGLNMQALLLGALQVLLARYSGQGDIVVGVPVALWDLPESLPLLGYFVNPVPVRCCVDPAASLAAAARAAAGAMLGALRHSLLPFQEVVREAGVARLPGVNPIFQVLLGCCSGKCKEMNRQASMVGCCSSRSGTAAQPDLSIEVQGCSISAEYSSELFDATTILRMMHSYLALLQQLATAPDTSAGQAALLQPSDVQLLLAWGAGAQCPQHLTAPLVHEAFAAAAAAAPSGPCLLLKGSCLTYGDVQQRSSHMAAALVAAGVGPGVAVGVLLQRGAELPVAALAVWAAGGCYVPLDPSYPEQRLAGYLADSGACLLLSSSSLQELAQGLAARSSSGVQVLLLDQLSVPAHAPSQLPHVPRDAPAYIIFTSGSTGRPKGVQVTHTAFTDYMACAQHRLGATATDTGVLCSSVNFDAHLVHMMLPLLRGGRLVVAGPERHLDFEHMARLLHDSRVTLLDTVPLLLAQYLTAMEAADLCSSSSLRVITVGGDQLPLQLAQRVHALLPSVKLCNEYGPAEATIGVTSQLCMPGMQCVSIGSPHANVHCYVVDSQLQLVPPGVAGELLLAGPRLAAGYVGLPDKTAAAFIPNPAYSLVQQQLPPALLSHYSRAYRSGDLVRWLPDGQLQCLGRIDRQVKIAGVRIELGEVEAALAAAPGVISAVAAAVDVSEISSGCGSSGKRLVGYVTAAPVDIAAVLAHCRSCLLPTMVPSAVVPMDQFPLLPSGKVDVARLPPPWFSSQADQYVAPGSRFELLLQGVWQAVLALQQPPSVDADFFGQLGGTSLQVYSVMAAAKDALQLPAAPPATMLFSARTIAALAAALGDDAAAGNPAALPQCSPQSWPNDMRPLSANQQQMWVLRQLAGAAAYNMPQAVNLQGELQPGLLQAALDVVAARQEVLRTRYCEDSSSGAVGVVVPVGAAAIPLQCLSVGSAEEAAAILQAEVNTPFDLTAAPPVRALLLSSSSTSHVLCINMHHIAGDGWSGVLLWRELSTAYSALVRGSSPQLARLPVQYADVAAWQADVLSGPLSEQLRGFWRDALRGAPALLQLPCDRPRPSEPSHAAGRLAAELPAALEASLRELAARMGLNMQALLLGALQVLLARFSGQGDIVVGVPVAGRDLPESLPLLGYFVNPVPVRCCVDPAASLAAAARAAAGAMLGALRHSLLPFQEVVREAGVARLPGVNPIFQVSIQYLDEIDSQQQWGKAQSQAYDLEQFSQFAKFDLYLQVKGSSISAEYSSELFDAPTIQRIMHSYLALLQQLAAAPDTPAGQAALLQPSDVQLLLAWGAGAQCPQHLTAPLVHEAFAAAAAAAPISPCLLFEGCCLSYGDVQQRSSHMAAALVAAGVGPGVAVGVLLQRGAELPVAALAVWAAGGCYVPLDPSYPEQRLTGYLADSGARLLLSSSSLQELAQGLLAGCSRGVQVLLLDQLSLPAQSPPQLPLVPRDAHAYIIFTSGSTGRPKGVQISHAALADHAAWYHQHYRTSAADVGLLSMSANFDAHLLQMLPMLACGGQLVVAGPGRHLDADYMAHLLHDSHVTVMFTVPPLLAQYMTAIEAAGLCSSSSLRLVTVGGDQLPLQLVQQVLALLPAAQLWNEYGPTETTISTNSQLCVPGMQCVTIGGPHANVHCYVVDSQLQLVPPGVAGELLLAGPRLAAGYVGLPDKTATAFTPNPAYSLVQQQLTPALLPYYSRAYRSGDLVRWLPDGQLQCLGRIDRQVKIAGVRIELGEVEAALAAAPGVTSAMVAAVAAEGSACNKRLVGYVTPSGVDVAAVLAHCRDCLLPTMVPSAVVPVDLYPLLPSGKVDVARLPPPQYSSQVDRYVAPRSCCELLLQGVWQAVLALQQPPSVDADFFRQLGGTSLQVYSVMAAAKDALQLPAAPPATMLFSARTIAALAAALGDDAAAGNPAALPQCSPQSWPNDMRPLSANQQQMWVLRQLAGAAAYNMPQAVSLQGALQPGLLQAALDVVAARQEVLRTRYCEDSSGAVGVVVPAGAAAIPLQCLSVGSAEEVAAILQEEVNTPFDLTAAPPVRALLLSSSSTSHVLCINMHHIAGDGWSGVLLWRELSTAYTALVCDSSPQLAPLPVQYADVAAWQAEVLSGPLSERFRGFWRDALRGAPALLQLPCDRPRPSEPSHAAGRLAAELPAALEASLRELAARMGLNMQALLLGALQVLLARYSGQGDVVVGVPVAGRDLPESLPLLGYFVNPVPVRCCVDPAASLAAAARAAAGAMLGALRHSLLPFQEVVREAGVARLPGVNPIFQVLFQVLDHSFTNLSLQWGQANSTIYAGEGFEKRSPVGDLTIEVQGCSISAVYSSELFDAPTIQRMMHSYLALLQQLAAAPDTPAGQAALLQPSDVQLLLAWGAGAQCPQHLTAPLVHEAFAAAAAAAPISPCLLFEGCCLSYGDVQLRSSHMAAALVAAGVGPGVAVGVLLQRGAELPVAALAVWAAGGCYVPLDPSYPEQRLAGYLADSGAHLLLSSSYLQELAQALAAGSTNVQVLLLDQLSVPAEAPCQLPHVPRDAPAYIIFTSGSTGRPKGVQVTHTAFTDYMACAQQRLDITTTDTGVLCASINFDAHLEYMMLPLLCGGRLVVAGPERHLDCEHMARLLHDSRITLLGTVPPLLAQYLTAMEAAGMCSSSSLRVVIVGGDQLPLQLAQRVHALLPSAQLVNEYGPTEATIGVTSQLCVPGMHCVTIGGPYANVHCYVVDSQLQLVPPGVTGELLLAGPRLAAGYVGLPDKTAAAFIPNPAYSLVQQQLPPAMLPHYRRAYRSGDLVRWLPDGQLQCLGRIDRQVKIAGVRIELGEVEAALAAAPGVTSAVAAAVATEGGSSNKRLLGCVTPSGVDVAAVLAHCRGCLLPTMVPSAVVPVASYPLLPSGKVDFARLASLACVQRQAQPSAPAAPSTATEALILGVWQEVLQVSGVGVDDDYWVLGGTSLLAGVIMSKLRALTGLSGLPSTLAYTSPTIAGMAARIQQQADAAAAATAAATAPSAPQVCWLPQRSSTHPLVLLTQASVLLLSALLHVAAIAAPTYLLVVIIGWLGLPAAYTLTGPVVVCCNWALALVSIALRRVLVGRLPLGEHPLWGEVYLRWWTGRHLLSIATSVLHSCQGSPLHNAMLRLMGARVGAGVTVNTVSASEPEWITLQDGVTVGLEATLQPATLEAGGQLVIQPLELRAGCSLGSRSYVQGGCSVLGNCSYPQLTVLTPATLNKQQGQPPMIQPHMQHSWLLPALKVVAALAVMLLEGYAYAPLLAVVYALRGSLSSIAPVGLSTSTSASTAGLSWTGLVFWVVLLPLGMFMLPEAYFVAVVLVKRLLLRRPALGPDGMPLLDSTWQQLRHYALGRLLDSPLLAGSGLGWEGTWLAAAHYRALGARVGRRAMVPWATVQEPDLLVVGDDTEMGSHLCAEFGLTLQPCASVTNSCVVDAGCCIETGALLGDLSYLPAGTTVPGYEIHIGAPLMFLRHNREGKAMLLRDSTSLETLLVHSTNESSSDISGDSSGTIVRIGDRKDCSTHPQLEASAACMPPHLLRGYGSNQAWLLLGYLIIPSLTLLPGALLLWVLSSVLMACGVSMPLQVVVLLVGALLGKLLIPLFMAAQKWLFMGRMAPGSHRFFSGEHTRWLVCTGVQMALENSLGWEGTAFQAWLWRVFGARVGKDCCLFGGDRLEMDLLQLGDNVVVGEEAILQGHTIENHRLQYSATHIASHAVLGARASLLPGSSVQAGGRVGPCSLIMKGEDVTAGTIWQGLPAAPCSN